MSIRSRIGSLLLSSLLFLAAPPVDAALDKPHNESTGTGCRSCHLMTSTYPKLLPPLNHTPLPGDIDDTTANGLCWSCHNTPVPLECEDCHESIPGTVSAPYVATHSSLTTSAKYGNWTVECWVCHNQHSQEQNTFNNSTYGKYIRRSINLADIKDENGNTFVDTVGDTTGQAKAGTKSIVFTGQTGINSFADGDATVDGICEVCHTQTTTTGDNSRFSHEKEHTGLQEKDCTRCHPHTLGFKPDYQCLDCHDDPENTETNITRADIKAQFQGTSHHVQRGDNGAGPIENRDCYQCHWEADENGKVTTHHGATPDAVVDLVIYGAGPGDRPASYDIGTTAVAYTADGSREQIVSLNDHCLGCHDDDSQGKNIFGDNKAPDSYAWDGESIEERYAQTGTARWGKYYNSGANANAVNAAEKDITKAFSAHGNAANNFGGGYSTITSCFGSSITAQTCPDLGGAWNSDNGRCETISLAQCSQNFCQSLSQQSCGNAAGVWGNTSSICKDISKKTCDTGFCYMHGGPYNDENDYECYSRGGTYREGANGWICTDITSAQCSVLAGSTWVAMSGVWHVTASKYMQGLDYTLVPTRGGPNGKIVACFDCHNSHGSSVVGDIDTVMTTSYASVTPSGGILKDTRSGKGGYAVTYQPKVGGDDKNKNRHKAGAALCLNCHLTSSDEGAERPWSYDGTFGASAPILGYFDSEYLVPGEAGPQKLYPYKALSENAGGHFDASRPLTSSPMHEIKDICTPCHDPHGVSPSHVGVCDNPSYLTKPECIAGNGNWEVRQDYGIPLLKGTWLTSPYREDAAPAATDLPAGYSGKNVRSDPGYHIDQNTFADWDFVFGDQPGEGIQEDINLFAGLCLQCHTNDGSTADIDPDSGDAWETMDRVHETVKGWGAGRKHNFSCSKCHTPHNGSALPRLMVTNCLNFRHRGQVASGGVPHSGNYQSSGPDGDGAGSGQFPGGGTGAGGGWGFGPFNFKYAFGGVACHDTVNGGTWPDNQSWNIVTPWTDLAPTLSSPTATNITAATAILGATVLPDSGWNIIARGTVWGTATNPTTNAEAEGEATAGIFSHERSGLPPGSKIFYRGYATNNFGTGYSPEGTFYTEPEFQASASDFPVILTTGMTVSWTRNVSGNGVIVLMKQGSAVDSHPQDGNYSGYAGNPVFGNGSELGNGNFVVFKGDGTSVDVTGLYPGTTYHVAVYEYAGAENASGVNKGTNYKLPPEANYEKTTDAAPVLIAPTAETITSATAYLGAEVVSTGGQAITERGTVWGIAQNPEYPSANALSVGGTTGIYSHERIGLDPGAKIYYRGYAINSEGTGYSPEGSFYTEPDIQASGVSFTPTGDTEATVTWARGNGNGVIVLMKMGGPVDSPPEDGKFTAYSSSSVFGLGSEVGGVGSGNFVVHKGTGSTITVSGLYLGMTYHVAVYEYAGAIDTSGANQGTNYRQHDAGRADGTLSIPSGTYTYTFTSTGAAKSVYIPATATNIQFTVKGAGGGGGRFDDYADQQNGLPGHSVVSPSTLTDVVVTVHVAAGGKAALTTDAGAPGGWGNPPGQPGGNGDNAYGGAGGGGASAIYNGTTRLIEAAGGRGGRSADWGEDIGGEWVEYSAGGGGAGGGTDYGGTVNTTGGGAGGIKSWSYTSNPTDGGDGLVEITFTIP